jgi:hypothetical protein
MAKRTTIGFLAAPFAAALAVVLTSAFTDSVSGVEEFAVSLLVWWLSAAVFMVVIALPIFLVLKRLRLLRWWSALSTGLIVGGFGALTIDGEQVFDVVAITVGGGVGALVFWSIASSALGPNKSLERSRER